MSWLLLLLGVVGVVHAANALAPRKGPTLVFAWSFMASWITIELVWHHLFFGALATGLLVYFGALDEPAGVLGLVLMAITGVLLLVIGFSTGKTRGHHARRARGPRARARARRATPAATSCSRSS